MKLLCPTCGEAGMRRVRRAVTTGTGSRRVTVAGVEVDECPRCGERLYDLAALRRLREARRNRPAA